MDPSHFYRKDPDQFLCSQNFHKHYLSTYISAYEYLCKHHESRSAAFMYEPAIQDKVWIRVKESQMNAATVSLTNFPSN